MKAGLPSLNALRAFEATARLGSQTRAAEELSVTHGAISRQIRSLEAELGLRLFYKRGRGLQLSEAGLHLQDVAGQAFDQLRGACELLTRKACQAPFVLGCSGSLLARWLIPRLDRLQRDLPELPLQLSASDGTLNPYGADRQATLCFAEPPWPENMQVFELAPECIGPVLSPMYPGAAALVAGAPSMLLEKPLLHTYSRPQAWPIWAAHYGLQPDQLPLGQAFEHLYFLLEAALAGLGVAIAPQLLVVDDLRAGRLLAPWGFMETPGRLGLWVPSRGSDSRAEALADWLRQELES